MKIVLFTSGLGNQIFQYLFSQYLVKKYPEETIYGYYKKKFLNKHNGLVIHKVFDLELPPETLCSKFVATIARYLNTAGFKSLKSEESPYYENAIYFDGWWQDKRFFLDNVCKIKFRPIKLNKQNQEVFDAIRGENSVSIHVRRGDYCDISRKDTYSLACTPEYYMKALGIAMKKIENPLFFIFSDDIIWVRKNMNIPNAIYIGWNNGSNSYLDLYLMSYCKANIIANSTFSYWGAILGREKDFVIRPNHWIGNNVPNIFPENWINI